MIYSDMSMFIISVSLRVWWQRLLRRVFLPLPRMAAGSSSLSVWMAQPITHPPTPTSLLSETLDSVSLWEKVQGCAVQSCGLIIHVYQSDRDIVRSGDKHLNGAAHNFKDISPTNYYKELIMLLVKDPKKRQAFQTHLQWISCLYCLVKLFKAFRL